MIPMIRPGAVQRAQRGQRGQTMLLVAMVSTITLGLTAVAFRATDDAIQTEIFQDDRDLRDVVISGALGRGVELLRTGDPPKDPYRYVETTTLSDGSKFYTMVSFERQGSVLGLPVGSEGYSVVASPGTQADLIRHGPPPDAFGEDDPGNGNGNGNDDEGCEDDGKKKGVGWGVGGIPPGADQGGKSGQDGGDKPPGQGNQGH